MRLRVLGFWGAYPEADGATAGYLLEHEGRSVLIDCGSGVMAKLLRYVQPKALSACIITHFHFDHVADLGVLQYALLLNSFSGGDKVLPIYAPRTPEALYQQYEGVRGSELQPIADGDRLKAAGVHFSFMRTRHPVETLAVRAQADGRTFAYTSDSQFFPELADFVRGADLLVAEASVYAGEDGTPAGHMNAEEAGRLAAEAGVGRLLLTHLPHYGVHRELIDGAARHFQGTIALAHTGACYDV